MVTPVPVAFGSKGRRPATAILATPAAVTAPSAQAVGRRLNQIGRAGGYDCRHTLNLPAANRTQDGRITRLSMAEQRVVITKDANFVNNFLLHSQPHKLLRASTGNISTSELIGVIPTISAAIPEAVCASFLFETGAYAASCAPLTRSGSVPAAPDALGLLLVSGSPEAVPAVPPA
ncbi:hypothetical protein GCM10011495_10350 [Hymenobacter frigidus]|uniref:DUF5615 domain-containing protein n=1 Tax=Hymenobacter frigidus TaxID=1524095 RepID=A0ABQ1ZY73_9BACT|nr:hypothetical protein GCM10011495_10350 [Hymenobacter frigidus]